VILPKNIVLKGKILDLSIPVVMAIINVTPDSFYSGSRCFDEKLLLLAVEKALSEGASIIDVGGYSTRPGAVFVTEAEERERVSKALRSIRAHFPDIPISIDTFRATVAECAVKEFGVSLINDISGGDLDEGMFKMVSTLDVPYILMHMKGNPQTMQEQIQYDHFLPEILQYFARKIEVLRTMGFTKEIIIDPGFGFAKTVEQNYELLRNMRIFETFKAPVLAGFSRKSMIYKPLGTSSEEALNGTSAIHMLALEHGADILRVHDVKAAMEVIKLHQVYMGLV